jgi:hypothetical protein
MTDQHPPPPPLPQASFEGRIGVYRWGSAWSKTAMLLVGHLMFDFTTLTISGRRKRVGVTRDEVRAIRLYTAWMTTYVSVVYLHGGESDVHFATYSWKPIKTALDERGWPVIDEHGSGRYRSLGDSR